MLLLSHLDWYKFHPPGVTTSGGGGTPLGHEVGTPSFHPKNLGGGGNLFWKFLLLIFFIDPWWKCQLLRRGQYASSSHAGGLSWFE